MAKVWASKRMQHSARHRVGPACRHRTAFYAALMLTFFIGSANALAQNSSLDEAVTANGAITQKLALTEAQRSAIYYAALQQDRHGDTAPPGAVPLAVGAPVSPVAVLTELPAQAAVGAPSATQLNYVMVEGDVVLVDPVRLRVVDIIRGRTVP